MTLLQQGVTARAESRPDALALVFEKTRLTYEALEETSNRLARLLADAGVRRGDRVGLLMPKGPSAIVAMLAVLKADAICVPMDPASPGSRLARVLEVSDCRVILAAGRGPLSLHDALAASTLRERPLVGWLDAEAAPETEPAPAFTSRDVDAYQPTTPTCSNSDGDVAEILFTSGSTGIPKGVMLTHASIVHFIRWAGEYFGIAPADRVSQHPPLLFDVATFDIFGTLWAGAQLHMVPPELNVLPHKLAQFIRDAQLTQWFSVPSILSLMAHFDVVSKGDFPTLRRVLFAGEPIPTPTLIYWMSRLPHVQFTNLYGPTETTISSSYYTVPGCPADNREPIPIGSACDGEELLILDGELRSVAQGEIGELYIRGVGVSPGYWRDAEKTRGAFLQYPGNANSHDRIYRTGDLAHCGCDGLVYFRGRADTQIKSRGYRIELGEIDAALHSIAGLRESAAVAIPSDGFEGNLICCAYAPARDADIPVTTLRKQLAAILPGYMLPTRWRRYDVLPRNANGKIDRVRLKDDFLAADDVSPILEHLGALFEETFHIQVPSPDMDLLECGVLDSLQMVELLFQLERRFGFRVKIDDLDLDNLRTLSRIAHLLAAQSAAPDTTKSVPRVAT